jgi:hypothetical protein
MAATMHGWIYSSLRHFFIGIETITCNLSAPRSPQMDTNLIFHPFRPRMIEAGTFRRAESP